jgi:cytochrome c oxidase assembly protein subunit 11
MASHKNRNLALNLCLVVVGMLGLAYASVPLYRLFCSATGYGGTTREGQAAPGMQIGTRTFTINFNADIDPGLPWQFRPAQSALQTHIGEQTLTHYIAKNTSNERITGHATYNVIPFSAGSYFTKIECFCFKEQTLEAGQQVDMPVLFFVDPAIVNDPDLKDVKTITLSYTFFPVKNGASATPKP